MNFQAAQLNTWQAMYNQLLTQYSALAHSYHQQA